MQVDGVSKQVLESPLHHSAQLRAWGKPGAGGRGGASAHVSRARPAAAANQVRLAAELPGKQWPQGGT